MLTVTACVGTGTDAVNTSTQELSATVTTNAEYGELDDLPPSASSDIQLTASSVSPAGAYSESENGFVLSLSSPTMATLTDDIELTLFTGDGATRVENLFVYDENTATLSVISEKLTEFQLLLIFGGNELVISATDDQGLPLSYTITFSYISPRIG